MDFDGNAINVKCHRDCTLVQPSVVCHSMYSGHCAVQSIGRGEGDDGNTEDTWVLLEEITAEVTAMIGHLHMIQGVITVTPI